MDMFIITPALAKAARALLDWHQSDLARASGLSLAAVNNFERGLGMTRPRSLGAMQSALENAGIEFLPGGGLRRVDDVLAMLRFSGDSFLKKWNDDIYQSVRVPGSLMLTSSVDEDLWFSKSLLPAHTEYLAWAARMRLRPHTLIPEDHKVFSNHARQYYRRLPREMIGTITYCIYADRLAFVIWKRKQVVVMRNKAVVETFRSQFMYLWKMAKPA